MPKTVLVVDDDIRVTRLLDVNLRAAGYEVTCAADGVEALEEVAKAQPQAIVLDIMMPRMNGFDVLKRLKDDPKTAHIPIILLTAKDQDVDVFSRFHPASRMTPSA